MLSPKLTEAMNKQINAEIYSSYMYYSMSTYFEALSLKGFAHWIRVQALEELTHVQKFATFMADRGARALMHAVEAPPAEWDSPLAAAEAVYEHEVLVSGLVNDLMDLALEERDHATVNFMQWFIGEQVEEEASADEIVQQLKLVDKTKGGLFLLDKEMDKRSFVMPQELDGVF